LGCFEKKNCGVKTKDLDSKTTPTVAAQREEKEAK
jgi:hypothetical protein